MILITSAVKALQSLLDPGIFKILILTILLTLFCLVCFGFGVSWLAYAMSAAITNPWMSGMVRWGGGVGAAIFAWFLFPSIMPVVVNFFVGRIAGRIEAVEYPGLPPGQGGSSSIIDDLLFSLKAIALNILALPLYLVPGVNFFVFYLLNGWLLGKEFFRIIALRHMGAEESRALYNAHSVEIFLAGIGFVFTATIPFINLVAPVWAVVMATHLFHALRAARKPLA